MIKTLMLVLVAAAIVASHSDTHALSSNGKRRGHGEQSESVVTFSSHEYSSQPVSSVPEVATIVLVLSGAAGLALWRRRK